MTCCCCLRPPNSSKCIQMWWLNLNLHDCWFDPSRNCKKIVEMWNQDASELWQKYVSSTCSSLFCFFGIFWSIRFTAELGKELEWWPTGRSWHANGQRATWKMSAPVGWWVCGSGGESLVLMLYGLYSLCVCVRFEKKVGEGLIFICFCEHCEREECDIVLLGFFAGSCLPWKLLLAGWFLQYANLLAGCCLAIWITQYKRYSGKVISNETRWWRSYSITPYLLLIQARVRRSSILLHSILKNNKEERHGYLDRQFSFIWYTFQKVLFYLWIKG